VSQKIPRPKKRGSWKAILLVRAAALGGLGWFLGGVFFCGEEAVAKGPEKGED